MQEVRFCTAPAGVTNVRNAGPDQGAPILGRIRVCVHAGRVLSLCSSPYAAARDVVAATPTG
jgi:hypothetical protein